LPHGVWHWCVFQFIEGLSDRQAADAVRSRIDWKYILGLELADPGFDFSVLSEFRARLVASEVGQQLLDTLVEQFKARGWLVEKDDFGIVEQGSGNR
jgi:transposase